MLNIMMELLAVRLFCSVIKHIRSDNMTVKSNMLSKAVIFTLIIFLLSLGIVQGVTATAVEHEPQMAPLNPEFIEYMDRLEEGEVRGQTADGYPLGAIPSPADRSHVWDAPEGDFSALSLPVTYDLRTLSRVTPVRNQNPHESCWTFATYGSMESYLLPVSGPLDFSENNLMLLHGFDLGPDCGGNDIMSTAYLSRWSGPVLESQDPYGTPATRGLSPIMHIQRVEWIPRDINAIKQKIKNSGAIYTHMYWEDVFYRPSSHGYYYSGSNPIDHVVALVGWNDNYSRHNFNSTPPGDGAWIVRNSWGTGWGDGGYFYISYYDTHSGRNAVAFHNAEPTTNYNRIYQYDTLGYVSSYGYNVSSAIGANIFTAQASENLVAVSTYALAQNTSFEIKVYTGVSGGNPLSGSLRLTQSGSVSNAGYYTVNLNSPVALTSGERFSVVIRYTAPGQDYPVPVEASLADYSSKATANSGESFLSSDGGSWTDMGRDFSANICIKAFTRSSGNPGPIPPPPGPEGVTLSASPSSPTLPGQRVTFTANTTGMTNPVFQFWYRSAGGRWLPYGGPTTSNSFSYSFPFAWSGYIGVQARGQGSNTVHSRYISHRVDVPRVQSVSLTAHPYYQARPYQIITLIAQASGGHNPEYAFYFRIPGRTGWNLIRGYSSANTISVYANGEFNVQIAVIAKSKGSPSSYDASRHIDYRFRWSAAGSGSSDLQELMKDNVEVYVIKNISP